MNMRSSVKAACLIAATLLVSACATSGPTFMQMQATPMRPVANNGRIFVYRSSALGAALQPSVMLDGTVVGESVPHGYFFIDRPAGNYKLSTSTEVERVLSLTLVAGQTRFVRLDPSFGFFVGHISPILVDEHDAQQEIADLHYIGK